ncbi:basic proline-rich protein-like [Peromyscus californicus insignis]|uniref:basic proline-rich protein-like n=1 Tax=Peromyscus californicus insignis TaxID=564181 RepID=UPI0022A70484|nr:basic proline-rich protein-like [Peromyscus californicus insignis]
MGEEDKSREKSWALGCRPRLCTCSLFPCPASSPAPAPTWASPRLLLLRRCSPPGALRSPTPGTCEQAGRRLVGGWDGETEGREEGGGGPAALPWAPPAPARLFPPPRPPPPRRPPLGSRDAGELGAAGSCRGAQAPTPRGSPPGPAPGRPAAAAHPGTATCCLGLRGDRGAGSRRPPTTGPADPGRRPPHLLRPCSPRCPGRRALCATTNRCLGRGWRPEGVSQGRSGAPRGV